MKTSLYRLIYCSHSRIQGSDADIAAELQTILSSARRNNSAQGVTGALLFNEGCFAQALEGPLASVESIFEKIQCDPRHSEVVVVQSGPVETRRFTEWSMAFSGATPIDRQTIASAAFQAVADNAAGAGKEILSLLKELIVQEDDWILLAS